MNFINFNPENRPPLAFNPSDIDKPQPLPSKDNTFASMLKEISEDPAEKKEIIQEKIPEKIKEKEEKNLKNHLDQKEKIDDESKKISKLLEILEKLIQQKEISSSELALLHQNLPLMQKALGNMFKSDQNLSGNFDFMKFLQNERVRVLHGKLPQEALTQIKQITEFLIKEISSQDNQNPHNKTVALEKLTDLDKWTGGENRESKVTLEDTYIKSKDRFDVLKGTRERNLTSDPNTTSTQNLRSEERSNPTHQNSSPGNNPGVMTRSLKNLAINFSNRGEGSGNFSNQGLPPSPYTHTPTERVSGMFTENGLPQSLNFKSLIQYLTGRIHNGFVSGKQVMLVKLQPENLGQVQVLLKKEGENSLHLKLKVDSTEIKELLDKNTHEIKSGLNKNNLDLLSFNVDVSDLSSGLNRQEGKGKGEKEFNEFSSIPQKEIFNEENTKTVDLRIRENLLNIRI